MENNGFINARFNDLLQILDAKTQICVFENGEDGKEKLRFSNIHVYELLAIMTMEKKTFRNYEVVGIVAGLTTNILIKKES